MRTSARQFRSFIGLLAAQLVMASIAFAVEEVPENASLLEKSLAIDYWDSSRFLKFFDDSPLTEDEEAELHRLVARLNSFDRRVFYASEARPVTTKELIESPEEFRGKLVRWEGEITNHKPPAPDAGDVHECLATSPAGIVAVYTYEVPERWQPQQPENRRIAVDGVFVKIDSRDGEQIPILASPSIEWMPTKWNPPEVNYGMSVMGVLDVDVSLLDNIAHRQPLTSRETGAFYRLLSSMRATNAAQLVHWAERQMPRHKKQWSEQAEVAEGKEQLLAKQVAMLAEESKYSVAPFFNSPAGQVGELVTFDGTVRRALRVEVASDVDAAACGLDHYYELAMFTNDSKNNPIMFCVLELPDGFKAGDNIREPVRIAGFFFKNWRYTSRASETQLRLAPLFISQGPLELLPPAPKPIWGWIAGLGFVAIVLVLWLLIWLRSRSDGQFEAGTLARIREAADPFDASQAELLGELSENTAEPSSGESPSE